MIAQTAAMEFVTTATETEALLLEANLIKQLKPRFNVLMRDDKSLPYILVTADHEAPQIVKHRGARKRQGRLLRALRERLGGEPHGERPAARLPAAHLHRQLLREPHPALPALPDQALLRPLHRRDPARRVRATSPPRRARSWPASRNAVKDRMRARCRRRPRTSNSSAPRATATGSRRSSAIQGVQGVNTQRVEEADVFALDEQAGQFCVEVFFFRNLQNWGNRAYFPKADQIHDAGRGAGLVHGQFYDDKPAPADRAHHRTRSRTPNYGRGPLDAAPGPGRDPRRRSAASGGSSSITPCATPRRRWAAAPRRHGLAGEASRRRSARPSGSSEPPRRVEVYDNSHIMGTNAVGGMIVAGPTGFMKQHYRTFNIKSEDLTPGDDYGMMSECCSAASRAS